MRSILILAVVVGLAGCTAGRAQRVDAQRPSVTYEVSSDRQFQEARMKADDWCGQNYSLQARLVDRRRLSNNNDAVVFDCVS